ncbi:uncharacterized protein LOC122259500 [Penaeus japonicus]|uniref:uncharacterized protein LOC122259500 n=1 Tax=Penaeus japonicus TaxID=27405 RepID=UPI001C7130A8|nr:uncharacterized protein LOC122259500 [Penaeus japonicus]
MFSLTPKIKHSVSQRKHQIFLITLLFLVTLMTLTSPGGHVAVLTMDNDEFLKALWQEKWQGQVNRLNLEDQAEGPLMDDDPDLLRLLKDRYLSKPSDKPANLMLDLETDRAKNYNIYRTAFHSWIRINKILKKLFSEEPPSFFVEAGALDGEFISNTLFLERDLGWAGLLVEADPILYAALPGKNRRAWSSQSCLSPSNFAQRMTFETYEPVGDRDVAGTLLVRSTGNLAGIRSPTLGQMGSKIPVDVQCFPLFSYLLALNATSVGYVSLDVEGAEADILLHLPWDRVDITVWNIEHRITNDGFRIHFEEPWGVRVPPSSPGKGLGGKERKQEKGEEEGRGKEQKDKETVEEEGRGKEQKDKETVGEVIQPKKVVYVTQHDPASGKDEYLVRFMREKGYRLYDYWDGDYTFIKANSEICRKHCTVETKVESPALD